ncbi:MAG: PIG-L family deacetylase [Acidimicrobiia bacterium]|nr:PIG-L family deacetylase [Acidimicrobiia bacterium]
MATNLYSELRGSDDDRSLSPARALAIGAHPDDIEFGAGGTLAGWAANCDIAGVIVTDGSKGSWNPDESQEELVEARKVEARAAANRLGIATLVFLGEIDGELEYTTALRKRVSQLIRQHRPDVVLSHDPWQRYQLHPDHRATGWAVIDGVVSARDPLFYPDQGPAHRPEAVLLWSADEPNHAEDISTTIDVKIAALLEHSSQGETTMGDAQLGGEPQTAFRNKMVQRATESAAGTPYEMAEQFRLITP